MLPIRKAMDEYLPARYLSLPRKPPRSSLTSMDKGEELLWFSAIPVIPSNESAGKVLLCLKREEPSDYESTNGIEGAWVFHRKPARACMGLNYIGTPFGGIAPDHWVRH